MKKIIILLFGTFLLSACTRSDQPTQKQFEQLEARLQELRPALGEIMGVVQQHHAKLYYAAEAANWPLASYELGEIKENLDSAVSLYPQFKKVKAPLNDLVKMMDQSLAEVDSAIQKRDSKAFSKGFNTMTESCNNCHHAAERGFVVIQTPRPGEFSNQQFTPR